MKLKTSRSSILLLRVTDEHTVETDLTKKLHHSAAKLAIRRERDMKVVTDSLAGFAPKQDELQFSIFNIRALSNMKLGCIK